MTQSSEAASAAPSMATDPPRRRRRLVIAVFVVAALVAVAGGWVAWHRVAAHRADQVQVAWAGLPRCTGAEVSQGGGRRPSGSAGALIKAERGMRCTVTVEVRNRGGDDVHLEHARMPMMGPGAGAVIKVDTASDPDLWDIPDEDDMAVLRVLGTSLGPGEAARFEIPIVFRESGCSGGPREGGFTSTVRFPAVTVTSLRLSFVRKAGYELAHTQVSPSRGCVRMSRG